MAAKRSKYEDYDNENKGKMWKVLKPLLIALAIALGICLLSLALADAGFFPGSLLNRFTAASFMEKRTAVKSYRTTAMTKLRGTTSTTVPPMVSHAKSESRTSRCVYDGYYHAYLRNKSFESVTEDYLNAFLNQKWTDQYSDKTAIWYSTIDIPVKDSAYPSAEAQGAAENEETIKNALKAYGGSLSFTLEIRGENITMEEYKGVVYRAVDILQQEMDNRPQSLQVYYYRQDAENGVLQYESTLRGFSVRL